MKPTIVFAILLALAALLNYPTDWALIGTVLIAVVMAAYALHAFQAPKPRPDWTQVFDWLIEEHFAAKSLQENALATGRLEQKQIRGYEQRLGEVTLSIEERRELECSLNAARNRAACQYIAVKMAMEREETAQRWLRQISRPVFRFTGSAVPRKLADLYSQSN